MGALSCTPLLFTIVLGWMSVCCASYKPTWVRARAGVLKESHGTCCTVRSTLCAPSRVLHASTVGAVLTNLPARCRGGARHPVRSLCHHAAGAAHRQPLLFGCTHARGGVGLVGFYLLGGAVVLRGPGFAKLPCSMLLQGRGIVGASRRHSAVPMATCCAPTHPCAGASTLTAGVHTSTR